MMSIYIKCKDCIYSKKNTKKDLENDYKKAYQCRIRPPQIIHGTGTGWSNQQFPDMNADDWCGHGTPKSQFEGVGMKAEEEK